MDAEGQGWRCLKWDQEATALVPDEGRAVVAQTQAVETLQDVLRCSMHATAVTRFFPTRPLTPELKGEAITVILQFALKGESANRLVQHMHTLSGLAVAQLWSSQLRPAIWPGYCHIKGSGKLSFGLLKLAAFLSALWGCPLPMRRWIFLYLHGMDTACAGLQKSQESILIYSTQAAVGMDMCILGALLTFRCYHTCHGQVPGPGLKLPVF